MNKADEKELGSLHGALAKILREQIELEPSPALLNVARQFLKDNKIEAIGAEGSPLHDLADLPVFEDDNIIPMRQAK